MDLEAIILATLLLSIALTPFVLGYQFAKWRLGKAAARQSLPPQATTYTRAPSRPALSNREGVQ